MSVFPELNSVSGRHISLYKWFSTFSFGILRCFSTWKEAVEQKALDRCNLAHLRAVSLRKHFQQWVGMLQVRGGDKQAVVNLFLLRWRHHYGEQLGLCAESKL